MPNPQNPKPISLSSILDADHPGVFNITTKAPGPSGSLPLTEDMLRNWASGDIFGMTLNAGMGWEPSELTRPEHLILSNLGGLRADNGKPIALGYHTGHWEVGLLMQAAAHELKALGCLPFAGMVTDPCDGRSQGTKGMMDSLPFRNDAAIVLRRLIRSLPRRAGVMGIATCDKGLPAMLMALAGTPDLPVIIVPGGVTLPAENAEDAGKVQTIGARFSHGLISLEEASAMGCRACGSPGGGCQFLGTAATSQVIAEALGLALPHSALAPSGQPIWLDIAARSARALSHMAQSGIHSKHIITSRSLQNAMVVHAAVGGSTNLLLHIPAIAHAAGLPRPTYHDWTRLNKQVPRLVDALPNGPVGHTTVRVFLAGGVPEVMLHLRKLGLLDLDCLTVTGQPLGDVLDWWESSDRRRLLKDQLKLRDGIDASDVIMSPASAKSKGLTSTTTFPRGNLTPEGSVIKSTAIDASMVDPDGVYRKIGPARVYVTEDAAIEAIKWGKIKKGDVMLLLCRGPLGAGMPETYQLTSALKHLPFGKHVALLTDGRFSGVSTGACVGHIGPEALAGGPIGKVKDGDLIQIIIDRNNLTGSIDLIAQAAPAPGTPPPSHPKPEALDQMVKNPAFTPEGYTRFTPETGATILDARTPRPDLAPDPDLPPDTRLWAALQSISGGTWGGCVYDDQALIKALKR